MFILVDDNDPILKALKLLYTLEHNKNSWNYSVNCIKQTNRELNFHPTYLQFYNLTAVFLFITNYKCKILERIKLWIKIMLSEKYIYN